MVDLQQLTQEQRWGLLYAVQQWNVANPEDQLDEQTYINRVVTEACNSYYGELLKVKTEVAVANFQSATPEVQAQVFDLLDVPDIVEEPE